MDDRTTSPFDARSTADEVLRGRELRGQRYLVTGGYAGLGLATCRALARAGADVVVAGRDLHRAGATAVELRGLGAGTAEPLSLDLADPESIDAAVEALGHTAVRAVVANAGVMACPLQRTAAGWEWQLAVNVLGHARLVWRLLPALQRSEGRTRVVMLSSAAHHGSPFHADDPHFRDRSYDRWDAYAQSKTGDSLFAVALQAAAPVDGLDAFAVHPGPVRTRLQRHLSHEELAGAGRVDAHGEAAPGSRSPEQGAATQVWAATDPALDGRGGRYLEDCAQALPWVEGTSGGVRDWAVDHVAAEQLWRWCARELRLDAPT